MNKDQLTDLLHQMTLTEKIDQLVMLDNSFFQKDAAITGPQVKLGISEDVIRNIGSAYNVIGADKVRKLQDEHMKNSRLHIPLLFCGDVIYGLKTVMPIPLGYSCSWDPETIEKGMSIVADEASASGIHTVFSPMLDLSRDPRWGRVMEGLGEDPYLASQIAASEIKGLQGNLDSHHVASCIKHFAAYGAAEGGRDYNSVDMSERKLRQEYLKPYQSAVQAGAKMVMPSFNTINGIPSTANKWLLKKVLEEEWGFHGVKVSDYAAIQELVYHGYAEDAYDAAEKAIHCGVNFDMKTSVYANYLQKDVEDGRVKEEEIDEAVMQILNIKNELGLFEDPYRQASVKEETARQYTEESRRTVKKLADESVVLLENHDVLPLNKNQKIALIGPMADSKGTLGMWAFNTDASRNRTLREELTERVGQENVKYAWGCDFVDSMDALGDIGKFFHPEAPRNLIEEKQKALEAADASDVIVFTMGEHAMQSGEASSRTDLSLPSCQMSLLHEFKKMRKPVVVLIYSGRPLLLQEAADNSDALLQVYWPGSEGASAVADVLTGKINPSGKLTMSMPRSMGQIPVYYSQLKTGRPLQGSGHTGKFVSKYLDCPNSPLYCFGYGLSYTDFTISQLSLDNPYMNKTEPLHAVIHIKNIGNCKGDTIVQLYIHDEAGTIARPVKELIDFKSITLEAGEEKDITFGISEEKLRYYDANMDYITEPGKFMLYAGLNSEECIETEFTYQL